MNKMSCHTPTAIQEQHKDENLFCHIAKQFKSNVSRCQYIFKTKILSFVLLSEPTRILRPPEYRVVQRNRDVMFGCKVRHDPSLVPTVTWLKDNEELPDDER